GMPSRGQAGGFPFGSSGLLLRKSGRCNSSWIGNEQGRRKKSKRWSMRDNLIRVPTRSLKEQFSRGSDAWKEQSDPIFRFWADGDWWGFPFFSLSASRYFAERETLCLHWPVGSVVITGPKVLDFYAAFCAHRATCLKADGKDITDLRLILNVE